jgi:hypothetical protein
MILPTDASYTSEVTKRESWLTIVQVSYMEFEAGSFIHVGLSFPIPYT